LRGHHRLPERERGFGNKNEGWDEIPPLVLFDA
jgi:hypothetical protein